MRLRMPQSVVVNGPFNNSTIQDQMLWLHETMKLHIKVDVPNSIHYLIKHLYLGGICPCA